jgi:hypothetical protein
MAHGSIDYRGRGQTSNDQKLKAKIKKINPASGIPQDYQ